MISKITKFINDVKVEMAKVVWPTREELINSTMIVAVVGVLFTLFIFVADMILSRVIQLFL
ncbi:MAG: preprotein translocase subunit SecE [Calditrichia bacterium]|nr:preprotein translocase subunit SecE [Calditrichia bacterium]